MSAGYHHRLARCPRGCDDRKGCELAGWRLTLPPGTIRNLYGNGRKVRVSSREVARNRTEPRLLYNGGSPALHTLRIT